MFIDAQCAHTKHRFKDTKFKIRTSVFRAERERTQALDKS